MVPCPTGDLGISTRPRSATPLLVSTTSTGLLCLLVGAHEHRGRSKTKVECVATTTHISHLVCDTYVTYLCILHSKSFLSNTKRYIYEKSSVIPFNMDTPGLTIPKHVTTFWTFKKMFSPMFCMFMLIVELQISISKLTVCVITHMSVW